MKQMLLGLALGLACVVQAGDSEGWVVRVKKDGVWTNIRRVEAPEDGRAKLNPEPGMQRMVYERIRLVGDFSLVAEFTTEGAPMVGLYEADGGPGQTAMRGNAGERHRLRLGRKGNQVIFEWDGKKRRPVNRELVEKGDAPLLFGCQTGDKGGITIHSLEIKGGEAVPDNQVGIIKTLPKNQIHRNRLEGRARQLVEHYKKGYIVCGTLMLEDMEDVTAFSLPCDVLDDGYFCYAARSLGEIAFQAPGYASIELDLKTFAPANCEIGTKINIGEVKMRPIAENERVALTGRVVMDDGGDPSVAMVSSASTSGSSNAHYSGVRGIRSAERFQTQVAEDGSFALGELTPMKHVVGIYAPGYVRQTLYNQILKPVDGLDLGVIELKKLSNVSFEIEYIEEKDGRFAVSAKRQVTLENGTYWCRRAGDMSQALLAIQFTADSEVFYDQLRQTSIIELGKGVLDDFCNIDTDSRKLTTLEGTPARDGHVYLLKKRGRKEHVLFRVTIDRSAENL